MHKYNIDELIGWIRDGVIWWVLAWTPLNQLVTVPNNPPNWWYEWFSWPDWNANSDNNWHPFPRLAELWLLGCWRLMGRYIAETADEYTSNLDRAIHNTLGSLAYGFSSFAGWVSDIGSRLGYGALFWATSALDAAQRLWTWLPNEVKLAGISWTTLLDSVRLAAISWVISVYDDTRLKMFSVWSWLSTNGNTLVDWYNSVRSVVNQLTYNLQSTITSALGSTWSWLQSFKDNPSQTIFNILGSTWSRLVSFDRDALTYWYNVWSRYASELSNFLADPGRWVLDRITAEIKRIW